MTNLELMKQTMALGAPILSCNEFMQHLTEDLFRRRANETLKISWKLKLKLCVDHHRPILDKCISDYSQTQATSVKWELGRYESFCTELKEQNVADVTLKWNQKNGRLLAVYDALLDMALGQLASRLSLLWRYPQYQWRQWMTTNGSTAKPIAFGSYHGLHNGGIRKSEKRRLHL